MEEPRAQAICGKEALDLLNCVAEPNFDQEKCLRLLNSLRDCVLQKKVIRFSLAEQNNQLADSNVWQKSPDLCLRGVDDKLPF